MTRKTIPFSFPSGGGQTLAGLLDMPFKPTAVYGVFAPCFTCTKESHAAARVCRALAERGVAMLRFDTTGVGGSTGDLAATNFTTRVRDMIAACRALAVHYQAPRLLVGHSLSGTAALSAAHKLPDVSLIATIGAPADPARVVEKFRRTGAMKETGNAVEIDVLGRPCTFRPSFVDDMLAQDVAADTAGLKDKRLLIFHAPSDEVVSFGEAELIRERAGKNARLVKLDDEATHLFNNREDDAVQVAETLAAALSEQGKAGNHAT